MHFSKYVLMTVLILTGCLPANGIKPKKGPITESIYAIGIVKSERTYELKLGVVAAVKVYFVKEGDAVKTSAQLLKDDFGTIFKAPFDGVVTHLPFSIGETIAPSQSLLSLVDLKKLYLEASLEQQGALKVKRGQNVQISFESFRTSSYHGIVKNVLPRNSEFVVQVDVSNLPNNILPGMNADLSIEVSNKLDAILLPMAAVTNGHILIKKGSKTEKIPVVTGVSDSEYVEILSPLLSSEDEVYLPKDSKK